VFALKQYVWALRCALGSRLRTLIASCGAPHRTLRLSWGWRPRHMLLAAARTILVIRPDEIGDVVLTGPFLRALRQVARDASITLIVKPACRELVEHCPYIDVLHTMDFSGGNRRALRYARGAWRLRSNRRYCRGFDFVLMPRRGPDYYDSGLLGHLLAGRGAVFAHVERSASFCGRSANAFADGYYTNSAIEHEVLHNLSFLRWCGANYGTEKCLETWLTAPDREFAEKILGGGAYVAIATGAGDPARRWAVNRFANVAAELSRSAGLTAVQLGAPGDPSFSGGGLNLIGRTTLRQAAAVIERCVLFLGNDSGLKHLAAAVGTPVVEISAFRRGGSCDHSNSPARFKAWGVPHRVLQPPSGPSVLAIQEIDIAGVFAACRELIAARERHALSDA
jgi:ADP-heptose:LPS heptosyltransferase